MFATNRDLLTNKYSKLCEILSNLHSDFILILVLWVRYISLLAWRISLTGSMSFRSGDSKRAV